jgi:hypothetical protein
MKPSLKMMRCAKACEAMSKVKAPATTTTSLEKTRMTIASEKCDSLVVVPVAPVKE